jgi:hypothetical protein
MFAWTVRQRTAAHAPSRLGDRPPGQMQPKPSTTQRSWRPGRRHHRTPADFEGYHVITGGSVRT